MNNSGYSYKTSLPAQALNTATSKQRQCQQVLTAILKGANNLLQISQMTGIVQSTVSARVNDLIEDGKVKYEGFVYYQGMKRKRICIIIKQEYTQASLL